MKNKIDRTPYEFEPRTKLNALHDAEYRCQLCNTSQQEKPLSVHHLIPIWFVVNYCPSLSATLIKSIANAVVLCENCHTKIHKDESVQLYKALAIKYFGVKEFLESDYAHDRLERIYGKVNKPGLKMIEIQGIIEDFDPEQAYWILNQVVTAMGS